MPPKMCKPTPEMKSKMPAPMKSKLPAKGDDMKTKLDPEPGSKPTPKDFKSKPTN